MSRAGRLAGRSAVATKCVPRAVARADDSVRPGALRPDLSGARARIYTTIDVERTARDFMTNVPFVNDSQPSRSFPLSTCATHCSSLIRSSWMGVLLGTGDAQEVEGFFLDVCRPCGDCEGEVGREGGRDGVFGDGGEVV